MEHIALKGLAVWQIEDVVFGRFEHEAFSDKKKYPDVVVVIGDDRSGETLLVYLETKDARQGVWRCVTARKASASERKRYRWERGRRA